MSQVLPSFACERGRAPWHTWAGYALLVLCVACGDKRDEHERDDAQASGSEAGQAEDAGTSNPLDAEPAKQDAADDARVVSVEGGACSGEPENAAACPCDMPERGTACGELNLTCSYGLNLCTCAKTGFRCSLPLPE